MTAAKVAQSFDRDGVTNEFGFGDDLRHARSALDQGQVAEGEALSNRSDLHSSPEPRAMAKNIFPNSPFWMTIWPLSKVVSFGSTDSVSNRISSASGFLGQGAAAHDTPPYPFMPSPTFAHSSRGS